MLEGVLKGGETLEKWKEGKVSILGMLEGVLKGGETLEKWKEGKVSILGMLAGVLKVHGKLGGVQPCEFQSLVCWRGC